MEKDLHDKAWEYLESKGFTIGEKMMIRSHFASMHKDEYPFVRCEYKKGKVELYKSGIEKIDMLRFDSEKEVIIANAIYENVKDNFNLNDFIQYLKFTFRIIGVNSKWSE